MPSPSKACYVVLSVMDLAIGGRERPITREELAARHGLSRPYLAQILLKLRRAGIVTAIPGRRGGYRLARQPSDVSLAELLAAAGEECRVPTCPATGKDRCRSLAHCPLRQAWLRLASQARDRLQALTLADPFLIGSVFADDAPASEPLVSPPAPVVGMAASLRERLADAAVLATDGEGRVTLVSPAAARMGGWSYADVLGHPLSTILSTESGDSLPVEAKQVLGTLAAAGGRNEPVSVDVAPIRGVDGRVYASIARFHSLHEQDRLVEEMLRVNRLEAVCTLAEGALHGFSDLLTGIIGSISLARGQTDCGARTATALAETETLALRAQVMAKRLMVLAGEEEAAHGATPLTPLLKDVATLVLVASDCHWNVTVPEGTHAVAAGEAEVTQILQNLLTNADAATGGGGTIRVRAENAVLRGGEVGDLAGGVYVCLTVADDGDGVRQQAREVLFDPYFTTKAGHSGLGLPSCRAIVRRCRGWIGCTSEPGRGTTMAVYLPVADSHPVDESRPPSLLTRRRVLLMDDANAVRLVLSHMLDSLGYDCVTTARGEEAVASFAAALSEERPFDAVLLDVHVPGGLGGGDTFARLRELDPGLRGLVMTGYTDDELVRNYHKHGFRAAMLKPFGLKELSEAMTGLFYS